MDAGPEGYGHRIGAPQKRRHPLAAQTAPGPIAKLHCGKSLGTGRTRSNVWTTSTRGSSIVSGEYRCATGCLVSLAATGGRRRSVTRLADSQTRVYYGCGTYRCAPSCVERAFSTMPDYIIARRILCQSKPPEKPLWELDGWCPSTSRHWMARSLTLLAPTRSATTFSPRADICPLP